MHLKARTVRLAILGAAVVLVLLLYSLRLMQVQVVEGEMYAQMIDEGWSSTQTIKAARGEIIDRNGRPLAMNTIGRDVVIDRAFLVPGSTNEVVLKLIRIMEEADEGWIDNLPLTRQPPFRFYEGESYAPAISILKRSLGLNENATPDDVVYWLKDRYDLEAHGSEDNPIPYTDEEFRKIAGIRYEMERTNFNYNNPYTFATNIKIETVPKIKERSFDIPGVDVKESTIRQYVSGDVAPHIIGQIGKIYKEQWDEAIKDGAELVNGVTYAEIGGRKYAMNDVIGNSGAEQAFEYYLKGEDGERQVLLNAQNQVVDVVDTKEAVPGNTVVLTIDSQLQKVAQDSLERKILSMQAALITYPEGEGHEADAGAVAVIDVKTGEPLVLASYPSYNLQNFQKDYTMLAQSKPPRLLNRALDGQYTPGSIFKPVVALAGLNEEVITSSSEVYCGQIYTRFRDYQPRCLDLHGHINVIDALRWSCNIFFYDTGWELGIEKIVEYANRLGLGLPTGIELQEYTGRISSPELKARIHQLGDRDWQPGDVLQTSIGQMDTLLSPLQLANYAATLANNGKRMEVSILKSVRSYTFDKVIYEHEPKVVETIEADEAFDTIRDGMIAASRIGTARSIFGEGLYELTVASKTGTPETAAYPNSTFIAYAPAEDPEIAVCVIIEKGWHGYTGAPVAKDIFDAYFSTKGRSSDEVNYVRLLP